VEGAGAPATLKGGDEGFELLVTLLGHGWIPKTIEHLFNVKRDETIRLAHVGRRADGPGMGKAAEVCLRPIGALEESVP